MKIVMIASESNPFCKTGGLADVVYSLSEELVSLGEEVIVVLPFYKSMKDKPIAKVKRLGSYDVFLSWRKQQADIFECEWQGVTFYFVDNDYYFMRDNIYGYDDDGERYAFFALAARNLFPYLNYHPDVIHVHDWQTAMIPVLIKEQSMGLPHFRKTKFILTLHNEAFKGFLDRYFLMDFFGLEDRIFDDGTVRYDGLVSTLKAGMMYADKVVAVSPHHAKELCEKDNSLGLCGVLDIIKDKFSGIVNGVDTNEFNPSHDPLIVKNFDVETVAEGKEENKKNLLTKFMLPVTDGPVFGLVSRLTYQKGISLILNIAEDIFSRGGFLAILGSGEAQLEIELENLRGQHPDKMLIYRGYSNQYAHDIYAGSDFFLMPSLFEPCGIGQMIAERYGSLPIARATGGLVDTIEPYKGEEDGATGFLFEDFHPNALKEEILRAFEVYANKALFAKLRDNAMKTDHSWRASALKYLELYK